MKKPRFLRVRLLPFLTVLLLAATVLNAQYRIRYADEFRNMMQRAGHPVPEYVGNFATRTEAQAAINRAVAGDPSLRGRMEIVGSGSSGTTSSYQQPQYPPQPARDLAKEERDYQAMEAEHQKTVAAVFRQEQANQDLFRERNNTLGATLKDTIKSPLSFKDAPPGPAGSLTAIKQLEAATMLSILAIEADGAGNKNVARHLSDFASTAQQGYLTVANIPDVPQPTPVQTQLYDYIVQETKTVSTEMQTVRRLITKAVEKQQVATEKVQVLTAQIEKLKQPPPPDPTTKPAPPKEETDKLLAEAQALLNDAEAEKKKSENEVTVLSEVEESHQKRLTTLNQTFTTAREHPERSEDLLKELQGEKP